jgi:hypothetical protein
MALTDSRTIEAILRARDEATEKIAKLEKSLAALGKQVDAVKEKQEQAGQSGGGLDKMLGTLAGRGALAAVGLAGASLAVSKLYTEFDQLMQRAEVVTGVSRGFETLTRRVGESAEVMLAQLRPATQGLVSDLDLMRQVNNAVILGLPVTSESMAKLSENAVRLGRAMGVDANRAIESVIVGIGRQSRLWLDNIGIVVDADAAYRKMADSLGKGVDELTEAEKKLAFYNATTEAAETAAQGLGEQAATLSEHWRSLWTSITNSTDALVKWIDKAGGAIIPESNARAIAAGSFFVRDGKMVPVSGGPPLVAGTGDNELDDVRYAARAAALEAQRPVIELRSLLRGLEVDDPAKTAERLTNIRGALKLLTDEAVRAKFGAEELAALRKQLVELEDTTLGRDPKAGEKAAKEAERRAQQKREEGQAALDSRARQFERDQADAEREAERRARAGQAALDARARQFERDEEERRRREERQADAVFTLGDASSKFEAIAAGVDAHTRLAEAMRTVRDLQRELGEAWSEDHAKLAAGLLTAAERADEYEQALRRAESAALSIGSAIGQIAIDGRNAGEVLKSLARSIGQSFLDMIAKRVAREIAAAAVEHKIQAAQNTARIGALAAQSYAAAFASTAAIPIVGPALAPAAAAAAMAAVLAGSATAFAAGSAAGASMSAAGARGFASGGLVEGPYGRDVIPARLTAGETVLDTTSEEGRAILGGRAMVVPTRREADPLAGVRGLDEGNDRAPLYVENLHINAIDGPSVRRLWRDHPDEMAEGLYGLTRRRG